MFGAEGPYLAVPVVHAYSRRSWKIPTASPTSAILP